MSYFRVILDDNTVLNVTNPYDDSSSIFMANLYARGAMVVDLVSGYDRPWLVSASVDRIDKVEGDHTGVSDYATRVKVHLATGGYGEYYADTNLTDSEIRAEIEDLAAYDDLSLFMPLLGAWADFLSLSDIRPTGNFSDTPKEQEDGLYVRFVLTDGRVVRRSYRGDSMETLTGLLQNLYTTNFVGVDGDPENPGVHFLNPAHIISATIES